MPQTLSSQVACAGADRLDGLREEKSIAYSDQLGLVPKLGTESPEGREILGGHDCAAYVATLLQELGDAR